MFPLSTGNVPSTAFRKVDFPEPFVPMMMTHDPAETSRLTRRRERTSLGVPAWNVFVTSRTSSMGAAQPPSPNELRHNQRKEHENCGNQLQIIGTQPPAQRHCHQQTEQDGTHHRTGERQTQLIGSYQRFSND